MTKLKTGDPVEFEHVGFDKEGTIIEILPDGKIRIKDTRGYLYRYPPEKVRAKGTPNPSPYQPQTENTTATNAAVPTPQTETTNTNNQNQKTMAKKETSGTEVATTPNPATEEQKKKIKALTCKKHQRIFLLMDLGLEKEEIMKVASCNAGEISNVRKQYADKGKADVAKALLA